MVIRLKVERSGQETGHCDTALHPTMVAMTKAHTIFIFGGKCGGQTAGLCCSCFAATLVTTEDFICGLCCGSGLVCSYGIGVECRVGQGGGKGRQKACALAEATHRGRHTLLTFLRLIWMRGLRVDATKLFLKSRRSATESSPKHALTSMKNMVEYLAGVLENNR